MSTPQRARPWRRRLVRVVLALVAARVLLALSLPLWIGLAARQLGLSSRYESASLSLARGTFTIEGLVLTPREPPAAEPALTLEHGRFDLALLALLGGDLRVQRAELDGLWLRVERDEAGVVDWLRRLGPAEEPVEEARGEPAPYDLRSPLQVTALRVQRAELRLVDRAVAPSLELGFTFDAHLSHLGSPTTAARFELDGQAAGQLGRLQLRAEHRAEASAATARVECTLDDLRLEPLAGELAALGLAPAAQSLGLRGTLLVEAATQGAERAVLELRVEARDLRAEADRAAVAELRSAQLAVELGSGGELRAVRALLEQGELAVARRADGRPALFGVQPAVASAPETLAEPLEPVEPDTAAAVAPARATPWPRFGGFTARDLRLDWRDDSVAPAVHVRAQLESLAVGPWSLEPAQHDAPVELRARVPEVLGAVRADGVLRFDGQRGGLAGELQLEDARLTALAPYLAQLGLAPAATAAVPLRATLTAELGPSAGDEWSGALRAALEAGPAGETLGIEALAVDSLRIGPGRVLLGGLELRAPHASIVRDEQGAWGALGLRAVARTAAPAESPEAAADPVAPAAASASWPRIALERLVLAGARLDVDDRFLGQRFDATAALTLESFALGGRAGEFPEVAGRLHGELQCPPLLASAALAGELQSKPGPLHLDTALTLHATGLRAAVLAPYLAPAGFEPCLDDGSFGAAARFELRGGAAGLSADLRVRDVELRDGQQALLRIERLGARVGLGGPAPTLKDVDVALGEIEVTRDPDGALRACGLRWKAPQPSPEALEDARPTGPFDLQRLLDWPRLELDSVRLSGGVAWHDRLPREPVELRGAAKLDWSRADLGPGSHPGALSAVLEVPGLCRALTWTADLQLDPRALRLDGRLEAQGLDGTRLDAYLAPGLRCGLRDGRLRATTRLSLLAGAQGSLAFEGALADFELAEGSDVLASFASAECSIPRLELQPEELRAEIGHVRLTGLRGRAVRDTAGRWQVCGLVLDGSAPSAPSALNASADPVPPAPAARLAAEPGAPAALPELRLQTLELELAEWIVRDETLGSAAVPLRLAGRLRNGAPWTLLASQPETLPPLELLLEAELQPVGRLAARLSAAPFASEPALELDVQLSELRGDALCELAPGLSELLADSPLEEGLAALRVRATVQARRRGPLRLDWQAGFGAQVAVERCELLQRPGGARLLGIDGAQVDIARIDPARGEVVVRRVAVQKPFARLVHRADGLHVAGLVVKVAQDGAPAGAETPAPPPLATAAEAATPAAIAATAPAGGGARGGDFTIERLQIEGLDVEVLDETLEPAALLPLTGLDLEVRKLSTRALREPVPISFRAYVSAGAVELPGRELSSSLFTGIAGATGRLVAGEGDQRRSERRPLFDEVALNGRVTLTPALQGWIALDVGALELGPLRGFAAGSGLVVGDGLLDQSLRVRLQGERGMSVESRSSFSHLRLSEPPDGPIARYLTLPAPLDTVLFLLEDAEGQHKVPVSFRLEGAAPTAADLTSAAVGASASVIARAVASSPLRVLGSVGGIFGLAPEPEPPGRDTQRLAFEAGLGELAPGSDEILRRIIEVAAPDSGRVVVLEHQLSRADHERLEVLANPSEPATRALLERLRARKAELLRARDERAAAARVHYSVGRPGEAQAARGELAQLDEQLGDLEEALDRLGELLRPGAAKKAEARTRAACLRVGQERLEAVRRRLIELGMPAQRIEPRRARYLPGGERGEVVLTPRRRGA